MTSEDGTDSGPRPAAPVDAAGAGAPPAGTALEVFRVSLELGLIAFGGPIAHLGYFERVYVSRCRWLEPAQYANLVALCQTLPGPNSNQVGFLVGLWRAGWPGALAAWLGFTLPSALLMYALARLEPMLHAPLALAVVHGLKLAAVAIVAQAVWAMAVRQCPDLVRALIGVAATVALLLAGAAYQFAALGAAAIAGMLFCRSLTLAPAAARRLCGARAGWIALTVFAVLLIGLPALALGAPHGYLALANIFYRAGSMVFGGGHVVLPLLRDALVPGGWVSDDVFLAGYGMAQAMPGPLFTISAYLGAAAAPAGATAAWSLVACLTIFTPGLLLAAAAAALWGRLAHHPLVPAALAGVNAAVVGVLAAALYDPVWTTTVTSGGDALVVFVALALLMRPGTRPLLVVALSVVASALSVLGH